MTIETKKQYASPMGAPNSQPIDVYGLTDALRSELYDYVNISVSIEVVFHF
jgi:hypothetical protein